MALRPCGPTGEWHLFPPPGFETDFSADASAAFAGLDAYHTGRWSAQGSAMSRAWFATLSLYRSTMALTAKRTSWSKWNGDIDYNWRPRGNRLKNNRYPEGMRLDANRLDSGATRRPKAAWCVPPWQAQHTQHRPSCLSRETACMVPVHACMCRQAGARPPCWSQQRLAATSTTAPRSQSLCPGSDILVFPAGPVWASVSMFLRRAGSTRPVRVRPVVQHHAPRPLSVSPLLVSQIDAW